jgi:flagellar protein FliO/FliZ
MSWLFWLFTLVLLAAAGGAAFLAYKSYVGGDTSVDLKGWLFKPRPEPRLGVVEQATVDARRRLVLVRRDDVEHLIMTGGPVDVVIETGINAGRMASAALEEASEPSAPVFTRQPRNFGQAVNE